METGVSQARRYIFSDVTKNYSVTFRDGVVFYMHLDVQGNVLSRLLPLQGECGSI